MSLKKKNKIYSIIVLGDMMNNERIYMKTSQKHTHATYIMTSTFRVLDNHGLYFLLNNYSTHNIIIFRTAFNSF